LIVPGGVDAARNPNILFNVMNELSQMECEACRADALPVTQNEIDQLHPHIPEWKIVEINKVSRLRRSFKFPDFAHALAFTNRVGELAEEIGHHPAILTEWGKVTVSWWSHKLGGLHRNDFIMAAKTDPLA